MEERSEQEDLWEEGHLAIEAANKLHVIYKFENIMRFTDDFLDTINIINKDDIAWKSYMRFLDMPVDPDDYNEWNDHMYRFIAALVSIHILRLEIDCLDEDYSLTIDCTRTCFELLMRTEYANEDFSEEAIRKWTRNRHEWLPLELSLDDL